MALLQIDHLSFRYPETERHVLKTLSLTVSSGEFILLAGPSGCGKTTLLRLLNQALAPVGDLTGTRAYRGVPFAACDEGVLLEAIGFVGQDPEQQIIMDTVRDEIVFGLEQRGYAPREMKKRVAELVHFFGVESLLDCKIADLSGGQKQLVNVLAALVLKPEVLLLDEPTAQLDPVATQALLDMLERLNQETGMTIIIADHQADALYPLADTVYFLDHGQFTARGSPQCVIRSLAAQEQTAFLPAVAHYYVSCERAATLREIPLTVKAGRAWLKQFALAKESTGQADVAIENDATPYVALEHVSFQYERDQQPVLKKLSLTIYPGDFLALIGGNGSGKTTILKTCLGLIKPQRGKVKQLGENIHRRGYQTKETIAYLPQHPQSYFIHDTVLAELEAEVARHNIVDGAAQITKQLVNFGIEHLRHRHPYDCSGGEMQKVVLACLLLSAPDVLYIDEPTTGLDPFAKSQLGDILTRLRADGLTIVMVTHDIEFVAAYAAQCALIFDGAIAAYGTPRSVLQGNYFYTTAINRVTQASHVPEVFTVEEALQSWPGHRDM